MSEKRYMYLFVVFGMKALDDDPNGVTPFIKFVHAFNVDDAIGRAVAWAEDQPVEHTPYDAVSFTDAVKDHRIPNSDWDQATGTAPTTAERASDGSRKSTTLKRTRKSTKGSFRRTIK